MCLRAVADNAVWVESSAEKISKMKVYNAREFSDLNSGFDGNLCFEDEKMCFL